MKENITTCIKRVGGKETCTFCGNYMIKHGKSSANKIRFKCKSCNRTQVNNYSYKAYYQDINLNIVKLTKEGVGIRSTARLLNISPTTLLSRIITIAKNIVQPTIPKNKSYEVDEMRTFIKRKDKLIWIAYALEQETKKVVSFNVGRRTNKTLSKIITSLELSEAKKIVTDKLKNYKYLIKKEIHSTKHRGINHIERKNLNIRTHLKRLNRRTICFSRSLIILNAVLKIYFWS
jgi:IS1 family transposase/transposase-like protein